MFFDTPILVIICQNVISTSSSSTHPHQVEPASVIALMLSAGSIHCLIFAYDLGTCQLINTSYKNESQSTDLPVRGFKPFFHCLHFFLECLIHLLCMLACVAVLFFFVNQDLVIVMTPLVRVLVVSAIAPLASLTVLASEVSVKDEQ